MRPPTISERISFRWLPDPPSEPTTTLVLTSPKGHFVDVRIFKLSSKISSAQLSTPQNPNAEPASSGSSTSLHHNLQWAFAGLATHSTTATGQSKGEWLHLVDSKHPAGFQDSGVFEDLPDGDSLECGVMLDDELGREREYEEVWRDWEADPRTFRVWELQRRDGEGDTKQREGGVQGYFISMGLSAAGIVKNSGTGDLGVTKWSKNDGTWVREHALGEILNWLPTPGTEADSHAPEPYAWKIIEQSDD